MMAVDERARHELHTRLDEVLGIDVTTTLMQHLPPAGWGDVATKQDLRLLSAELLDELHTEIGGLRDELRTELHTELGGLRTEVFRELSALRGELNASVQALTRTYLAGNLVLVLTVITTVLAAARWL